ncbi:MAG: histidinol dehydrogenase [Gammaproteobacteria bacterium 39-13]|nr:histidinol dehydrogenase [Gammaproteobacteria bacterium]OJV85786.1 MAG: histidinol dehydrogenase [Gammaproteobacteria bacterium 39-13]
MKKLFWNNLNAIEKKQLLQRPLSQNKDALQEKTQEIIREVKVQGDKALRTLTQQFDKVTLESIRVEPQAFEEARAKVSAKELEAIRFAIKRIGDYAQSQIPENWCYDSRDGVLCETQWRAIEKVGLYVPGGSAALVSTVMMLAVPARIAGCSVRVMCTPPAIDGCVNPYLLVAAQECAIENVYKIGGAQAIAAMAYGTQTIPKVDKIFGPGNNWVTQAKILCAQDAAGVSIDLPAGPSEILIIADESANPAFVAADLLSQAEHDKASQVFLVSLSETFVDEVKRCLETQIEKLPRQAIAIEALRQSAAIIVADINQAIEISNQYGPEHLSLQVESPRQYVSLINNAGTVFLGKWTPETLGDYVTGANHVLPTAGATRMWSGLSVLDFMKRVGIQEATKAGLKKLGPYAQCLAVIEQLGAHENAVTVRLQEASND